MAPIKEKRIGGTEKRADSLLHYTCKYRVKLTFSTGIKDNNLSSERGSCRLCGSHFDITVWIIWIHEKSDDAGLRHEVMQQLQSLGERCRTKYGDTGSITARPAEGVY